MSEKEINKNEDIIVEWSLHRLQQDKRSLFTLLLVFLFANIVLFLFFREIFQTYPLFAVLGNLIIIGAISDYLFPMKFRLTTEGAEYRNLMMKKHIAWQNVRNCYLSNDGIKLSPLIRRSRLENFRGFMLLFNNNKEEIIEHVKRLAVNRFQ